MSFEVLDQAAQAFRSNGMKPDVEKVVEALLAAEQVARHAPPKFSFDQLIGEWRLCFATGTRKVRQGGIRLKKGYYVPKVAKAQISFQEGNRIGNLAQLGVLKFQLEGPARLQAKKNLLAFEFTQIRVSVGAIVLKSGAIRGGEEKEKEFEKVGISKLPFFAFFVVNENFIAARGRGGGLALWIREQGILASFLADRAP